jgi:molecular chaperone DnaK (HSP70)
MPPRYAIGIDLGTTNCVLAYVDLRTKHAGSEVLPIPQIHSISTTETRPLLPSFYYFPTAAEMDTGQLDPFHSESKNRNASFVVGAFARDQMSALPGRVVHSAKSWLAHAGIDRGAKILPFAAEEIPPELKLSPVEASAAYLEYLKQAWNHTFARQNAHCDFSKQRIVVTVPASFDEGAQALTRKAADLAGYPSEVRLLEEPQAAFYAWIESASKQQTQSPSAQFLQLLPDLAHQPQTVLVCDIGGGTSDFSLFRIAPIHSRKALPEIERIVAGDHLLLGGDNIDLALAHLLERRLKPGTDESLSRRQWNHLMPQARDLKEKILESEAQADEIFHVSVPGEGSSLFQSAVSTTVSRSSVQQMVLDGFFPLTGADEIPRMRQSGLREIGLPYAADSAISRHLAAFLRGQTVDAVLFAGGTLKPHFLQDRLLTLIERWQGRRPVALSLQEMSLAIAEGAAYFGAVLASGQGRIRGGYARSVYLELHRERPDKTPHLVCVLPQGFEEGAALKLASPRFTLLVNRPARFSAYTSNRRNDDKPGALVALDADGFHPLPPLHTTLTLEEDSFNPRKATEQNVTVQLEAELTELGVLQLALVNEELGKRWRLDFNLRKPMIEREPAPEIKADTTGVQPAALQAALERITLFYGKKQSLDPKDNVKSLVKTLERILAQDRDRWSVALLRSLWPALYPGITRRARSLAHENTWLYLAGFLLRPGYGAELDAWRITQLWECFSLGPAHRKEKSAQSNWWMMWRRTAGGLSSEQQQQLFHQALPRFKNSPSEFVEGTRLLGALESVPLPLKLELTELLFDVVLKGKAINQPHIFWALARLLSRVPLYGSIASVIPAGVVEDYFAKVEPLDWKKLRLQPFIPVFSAACRLTNVRSLDIHDPVRTRVVDRLRRTGAKDEELRIVEQYEEISAAERDYLFGEGLPVGLRLSNDFEL